MALRHVLTMPLALIVASPASLSAGPTLSQDAWEVLFFWDDFEAGAVAWDLAPRWAIEAEDSNHVLKGQGHSWANLPIGSDWTDYLFQLKVKLVRQSPDIRKLAGPAIATDMEVWP